MSPATKTKSPQGRRKLPESQRLQSNGMRLRPPARADLLFIQRCTDESQRIVVERLLALEAERQRELRQQ